MKSGWRVCGDGDVIVEKMNWKLLAISFWIALIFNHASVSEIFWHVRKSHAHMHVKEIIHFQVTTEKWRAPVLRKLMPVLVLYAIRDACWATGRSDGLTASTWTRLQQVAESRRPGPENGESSESETTQQIATTFMTWLRLRWQVGLNRTLPP